MRKKIRFFWQHILKENDDGQYVPVNCVYRQGKSESCGAACILMILDFFGKVKYPRVKQERKLYNLYRSKAFKGMNAAAVADCLSDDHNYMAVHLRQSFAHAMDNRDGYFDEELYQALANEYFESERKCADRIAHTVGDRINCDTLRQALDARKLIMVQCIVPGDADGIHDHVLHWIVVHGYQGKEFKICDPSAGKKRLTEEELEYYMDTPIGRICIEVSGMIDLLKNYINKSLPTDGDFYTNPNLRMKVDEQGDLLPFYGNTVVFDLQPETKEALRNLQERLYEKAGWMLSGKLAPETFHMTLHDLVNAPEVSDSFRHRMAETEGRVKDFLKSWKDQPPLRMKTTRLFNMVGTSIVLGLEPAEVDSWHRLDAMYSALETVIPLGYALTPHVTMAYFKPGTYTQEDLYNLRQVLKPVELDVELRFENLFYQEFTDMNHYFCK